MLFSWDEATGRFWTDGGTQPYTVPDFGGVVQVKGHWWKTGRRVFRRNNSESISDFLNKVREAVRCPPHMSQLHVTLLAVTVPSCAAGCPGDQRAFGCRRDC